LLHVVTSSVRRVACALSLGAGAAGAAAGAATGAPGGLLQDVYGSNYAVWSLGAREPCGWWRRGRALSLGAAAR
jgi:hypothetical protein